MKSIDIYLVISSGNIQLADAVGRLTNDKPSIYRGQRTELHLHPLHSDGTNYTVSELEEISQWEFVIDDDWITSDTPMIRVLSGISLSEDAAGAVIIIPLDSTNSLELVNALGSNANITVGAELTGFANGETSPYLIYQFSIQINNRRSDAGTGTPTNVPDGSISAIQIYALLANPGVYQFSVDTSSWHTAQTDADRYFRWSWDGVNYGAAMKIPAAPEPFEKTFDSATDDAELSWDAETTTEATIIHGLNLQAPSVVVRNNNSLLLESPVVKYVDANTIKLTFGETPTDELYVCIGYGSGNVATPGIVELSGAAVTVDGSLSDRFKFDPDATASTVSFANFSEGGEARLTIINGGTYVSFPAGIVWRTSADETQPPALQADGTDVIEFLWVTDTEVWGYLI